MSYGALRAVWVLIAFRPAYERLVGAPDMSFAEFVGRRYFAALSGWKMPNVLPSVSTK